MVADPSTVTRSLSRTASELARRWASQRLSAVQTYGRILADYGSGRASGRDTAQAYAKLVMEEAARYPTDVFGIASDYATAIARAAGAPLAAERSAQTASPVLDVELCGAVGKTVTRTIVLENPHDAVATIGFTATNFFDADQELAAAPTINPADATIPARGERAVKIGAKIDRKLFQAGRIYRASVAVDGFDELLIRIHLTVTGVT